MPITFSEHALEQLEKRGITQEVVIEVVQNPNEVLSSFRGRKLRRGKLGGTMLEVVTKTEGSRITIITAYLED